MAKASGFGDKVAKAQAQKFRLCPVCGADTVPVRVVRSVRNEERGSTQYHDTIVKVCKCNEKQVWG